MKVVCLHRKLTKEMVKKLGLSESASEFEYDLEISKKYTVLSISQNCEDNSNYNNYRTSKYPEIGIDNGFGLHFVPLYMFQVIDDRVSSYWHVKFDEKTKWLSMKPELFYEEFFYDDYTNDFPNIVEKYESTLSLLENEF